MDEVPEIQVLLSVVRSLCASFPGAFQVYHVIVHTFEVLDLCVCSTLIWRDKNAPMPFSNDRLNFWLRCFARRSLECTCVGGFEDQLSVVCALDHFATGAGSTQQRVNSHSHVLHQVKLGAV